MALKRSPLRRKSRSVKAIMKDKAWSEQSKFVRARDKKCVTCGSRDDLQAGHFKHGDRMDFVVENINTQCSGCNKYRHGNPIPYAIYLEKKFGHGIIQKLEKQAKISKQFTLAEYTELYEKFKTLNSQS